MMESHCSCENWYADEMKYLSCKVSITFGNHIDIRMIKALRMYVIYDTEVHVLICIYVHETTE